MKFNSKSNTDIFVIFFMLYAPLFFAFFDFGKNNVLTVKLTVIIFSFIYLLLSKKLIIRYNQTQLFIYYYGFSCLLLFNYYLMELSPNIFLNAISTYFASIVLLFYFFSFNDIQVINIIKKIIPIISVLFLFQLIGSIYESYIGNYLAFGEFTELKNYTNWQSRLIISKSFSLFNPFNFGFPLSGFLGQHNYWGGQLPFYNLLLLKLLDDSHKQKYFIIIALILLAAFLNTSRFAILAILITDIIFFVKIYKKKIFLNVLIIISFLIFLIILPEVISVITDNFYRADTFTYRVDNYSAMSDFVPQMSLKNLIIGYGIENLEKTYSIILGFVGNFESEILMDFIAYGIVGISVLFLFWYKLYAQFVKFTTNKIFGLLLLLNIVLVSITVNGISYYFIAPFVTLFYVYILSSEKSKQTMVNI